ncbi:hypothetical protein [Sediminibacillus sp. JSM 1682029]|uniref:hypothetical protein n=1 Tax=Sediminibacillus sp. JSM 1682029 TaxID=3229857 RepID=UPI0035241880
MFNNWLVEDRNELFLYDGRSLHQLKITPSAKKNILQLFSHKGEASPINDEYAYKMLKKTLPEATEGIHLNDIQIEKIEGNLTNCVLRPEMWYLYKIGDKRAVLFPGDSSRMIIHTLPIVESNDDECDWILDLYGRNTIVSRQRNGESPKTLLLDLDSKFITREITFFSEYEMKMVTDYSELFRKKTRKAVDNLTALEELEKEQMTPFVFYHNNLQQTPYKVTTSENNELYVGEDKVEQILRASYRNIELLLQKEIKDGTWLVVENEAQLLRKVSCLLFQEEKIKTSFFSIAKLGIEDKVMAMLQRFDPNLHELALQIQKDSQFNIYRIRCLCESAICTDWLYGYDPREMVIEILKHYFAVQLQNKMEFGTFPNKIHIEEDGYNIPEKNIENLLEVVKKNFLMYVLHVPKLLSNNIYLLNLQRK